MVKKNRNAVSSSSESKVKVGLSLTPYSADRLNAIARKLGISRSELFLATRRKLRSLGKKSQGLRSMSPSLKEKQPLKATLMTL
jgi:hypothetical protein